MSRILDSTSRPPTATPTVTGSPNQMVPNTTLTMGSSMETNAEVEAPSRLMPYIIRK